MSGHTAEGKQWTALISIKGGRKRFLSELSQRSHSACFVISALILSFHIGFVSAQEPAAEEPVAEAEGEQAKGLETPIFDVSFPEQKLTEVVDLLSTLSNVNINVAGNVDPKIVVNYNVKTQKTIREVLNDLASLYNLYLDFQPDGGVTIRPSTDKPQQAENIQDQTFPVRFNRPSDIIDLVRQFLSTSPQADALALDTQKAIVVRDIPEALARIEEFLNRIDIPKQSTVFPILYGDPEAVADVIRERLPDLEEGALTVDVANSQLIVKTTLDNLAEIQLLIETLDIKKEIRVFTISFHDVDDVLDMLEELGLLSEEGTIVSNPYTGKLIIQDTPERLDRIAEAIKAYDTPRPAVFVEAEIMDVNALYSFGWNPTLYTGDAVPSETNFGTSGGQTLLDGQEILRLAGSGAFEFAALDAGNVLARLQANESDSDAQTIASPRLIVERGEEARLTVGSEEPIGVRSFSDSVFTGTSRDIVTQRVREVGIRLIIEALNISERGYAELYVGLENSSVPPDGRIDIGGGTTGLRVLTANIETTAILKDGRTLALGGLLTRGYSETSAGTPFLNKVPLIRYFFSTLSKADNRRKLLLFITPHILNLDTPLQKYMQDEEAFAKLEGRREPTVGEEELAGFEEELAAAPVSPGEVGQEQWVRVGDRWGYYDENGSFVDRTAEFMGAMGVAEGVRPEEEISVSPPPAGEKSAAELLRELGAPSITPEKAKEEGPAPPEAAPTPSEVAPPPEAPAPETTEPTREPVRPETEGRTDAESRVKPRVGEVISGEAASGALRGSKSTLGNFKGTVRDLVEHVRTETGVKFGIPRNFDRSIFNSEIEIDTTNKTYEQVMKEVLEKQGMSFRYRKSEPPLIQLKDAIEPPKGPVPAAPTAPAPQPPTAPSAPAPQPPTAPTPPATTPAPPPGSSPQSKKLGDDPWSEPPVTRGWAPEPRRKSQETGQWSTLSGQDSSADGFEGSPSAAARGLSLPLPKESWEVPQTFESENSPNVTRKLSPHRGFERSDQPPSVSEDTWDRLLEDRLPQDAGRLDRPYGLTKGPGRHTSAHPGSQDMVQTMQQPLNPPAEPVALIVPKNEPPAKKGAWSKVKKLFTLGR